MAERKPGAWGADVKPPMPRVETKAPRKFGLPDFDAVYQEIQDTKEEARAGQVQIIDLLETILSRLPAPAPPPGAADP